MNKIIFPLLFVFTLSASAENINPTTFKNPIFSLPMQGYSRNTNYINQRITPTSIIDETNNLTDSCELLENNETSILMKCVQNDQNTKYKDYVYFVRYISVGKDSSIDSCFFELSTYKKLPETEFNLSSASYYTLDLKGTKNNDCGPSQKASWL